MWRNVHSKYMSAVIEVLGLSLPHSSTMAAEDYEKEVSAEKSAVILVDAIKKDIRPLDLMTKESFENAISVIMAIGGSTNAVLHILAIANTAGTVSYTHLTLPTSDLV